MSFIPPLGDPLGNNANTRTVSVQVMNEREPTRAQMNEAEFVFNEHVRLAALSLAGYQVEETTLSDGSLMRIVSNSGQHAVLLWPAGGGSTLPITIRGYLILPADKNFPEGWNLVGKPDSGRAYLPAPNGEFTSEPSVELHVKLQAGAVHWIGPNGEIISYDHGGQNRYATDRWSAITSAAWNAPDGAAGCYYKGTKITTPAGLSAVAIFSGRLVCICGDTLHVAASPLQRIDSALEQGQFIPALAPAWEQITIGGSVPAARRCSAWHFKPDGSRAGCAVMLESVGIGTWTFNRMLQEALPQAKRYLSLTLDEQGDVTAQWSDEAYTTEPFATWVNGSMVTNDSASVVAGGLTFTGRRLWGIDYADDGTELVVSCRRFGSGLSSTDATLIGNPGTYTMEWTQGWGIYVNEQRILKADYILPQITHVTDPPTSIIQTGEGVVSNDYIALHALDARFKAAVYERLRYVFAGPVVEGNANFSGYSANAAQAQSTLHHVFDGVEIKASNITQRSSFMLSTYARISVADFGSFYRYGQIMRSIASDGGARAMFSPPFPQVGSYDCENVYEQEFDSTPFALNRQQNSLFGAYPNQVTDTLSKLFFDYTLQINVFKFSIGKWNTTGPVADALGAPTARVTEALIDSAFAALGNRFALMQGLAIRVRDPLHLIVADRDSFHHQFYDAMQKLRQANLGQSQTGFLPIYSATLLRRSNLAEAFAATELVSIVKSRVDSELAPGSADAASFHIDPVKVL